MPKPIKSKFLGMGLGNHYLSFPRWLQLLPKLQTPPLAGRCNSCDLPKMVATGPLPPSRAPVGAGFPGAHACNVSLLPAPCSFSPPPPFCSRTLGKVGAHPFPGWQKGRWRRERELAGWGPGRTGPSWSRRGGGFAPGAAAARSERDQGGWVRR